MYATSILFKDVKQNLSSPYIYRGQPQIWELTTEHVVIELNYMRVYDEVIWSIILLMKLMLLFVFSDTDSALKKFLDETANMSADDRAKQLENNKVQLVMLLYALLNVKLWQSTYYTTHRHQQMVKYLSSYDISTLCHNWNWKRH